MAVFASALPLARASFASLDNAPKEIWETKTGVSSISGKAAAGPIIVCVATGCVLLSGIFASCAPLMRISSQEKVGMRVRMGSIIDFPVMARR